MSAIKVLLACARTAARPGEPVDGAPASIDWRRVIALAGAHRMLPQLRRWASRCGVALPDAVDAELRAKVHAIARRNLLMSAQLVELLEWLEREGIRALPIKGPVLAELVYGSVAARQIGDLDVLVPAADVPRAVAVLASHGYVGGQPLTGATGRLLRRREHHITLRSARHRPALELHDSLISLSGGLRVDFDRFAPRLRRARFAGADIWTLSPEDHFAYLCQHGAGHAWARLEWITTAAALDASLVADEARVLEMAAILGGRVRVGAARALAATLFDGEGPRAGVPTAARAANVRVVEKVARDPECATATGVERFAYEVRTDDTVGARVRRTWTMATVPQASDLRAVDLPEWAVVLHYALRPLRLLRRYGPGRQVSR